MVNHTQITPEAGPSSTSGVPFACQAIGLEDGGRFYYLWATAEYYWVRELRFGFDQGCAYEEHSPARLLGTRGVW